VIPTGEPTGRDVPRLDPASLRATTATAADEDVVTLENEAIDTAPAVAALAERDDATVVDARSTTIGVGGPDGAVSMTGAPDRRRPEATRAARPGTRLGGTTSAVRALASLPRTGGLAGDLRYVATVTFGVTRARRELARLDLELDGLRGKRRKLLIDLAADTLGDGRLDSPALADAGDRLAAIEDQRAKEAGHAAAADARADAARRDHDGEKKRLEDEAAAIETELAEIATELAPLERAAAAARKRASELKATLDRIDGKIATTEARKVSVKGQRSDAGAIDAELATLRADRIAVARDEPAIAAELDDLLPRIAELDARRTDARTRLERARNDLVALADELQERLRVVEAAKKVTDRALLQIASERDAALEDLGEQLAIERPPALAHPLRDVDELDLAIATGERRAMELREVLGSVHKGALARGLAVLVLIAAALGAFVWFILSR